MNKKFYFISFLCLLFFLFFSFFAFKKSLTPYVSFEYAKKTKNIVQIAGTLEKSSISYDERNKMLNFRLMEKDGREIIEIAYKGPKPLNFEDATSVVAIGYYNGNVFFAKQILVKCPSKYGKEERKYE